MLESDVPIDDLMICPGLRSLGMGNIGLPAGLRLSVLGPPLGNLVILGLIPPIIRGLAILDGATILGDALPLA